MDIRDSRDAPANHARDLSQEEHPLTEMADLVGIARALEDGDLEDCIESSKRRFLAMIDEMHGSPDEATITARPSKSGNLLVTTPASLEVRYPTLPLTRPARPRRVRLQLAIAGSLVFILGSAAGGVIANNDNDNEKGKLDRFEEVIEKAASVIGKEGGELYMAVDVPAYGDASALDSFRVYQAAIAARIKSADGERTRILWYSDADERDSYIPKDSQSIDPNLLRNSRAVRQIIAGRADVTEIAYPMLNDFQFWVWTDGEGKWEVVMAYVEQTALKAQVRGKYSNSPEVGEFLVQLFKTLKKSQERKLKKP